MDAHLLAIKKQIREWIRLDYIVPDDIPDIELYMDQITTFMDHHLEHNLRNDDDKTLTKTMINNYTKNKLLPPPEKKRYSKEHIILLIYIYYLKNVLSISDIQVLLAPMIDRFFDPDEDSKETKDLYSIYEDIFELEKQQYFITESSIIRSAANTDKRIPSEEDPYLNKMAFIYMLVYDIYSKKRLIEKMIDELALETAEKQKKEAKAESVKAIKTAKKDNAAKENAKKQPTKREEAKTENAKKAAAKRDGVKSAGDKKTPVKRTKK